MNSSSEKKRLICVLLWVIWVNSDGMSRERALRLNGWRHKGQDSETLSQPAKHTAWKICWLEDPHGSTTTLWSFSSKPARQMEQMELPSGQSLSRTGTTSKWKFRKKHVRSLSVQCFKYGRAMVKSVTKPCRRYGVSRSQQLCRRVLLQSPA